MQNRAILRQADALSARARRLLSDHRTRAKRDGVVLGYTLADMRQLLAASPCCGYCNVPVAFDASIDHRIPTSRGGKHVLANLIVCCSRCNMLKSSLLESEFRDLARFLATLHPIARQNLELRLIAGGRRYAHSRKKVK